VGGIGHSTNLTEHARRGTGLADLAPRRRRRHIDPGKQIHGYIAFPPT
jgi:hypothetical protein